MIESDPSKQNSTAHPMPVPRQIAFEFPEDLQPHWKPSDPEFCAMVNGASMSMPYLEPFLIRTMREAMRLIEDPAVLEGGRAFNMQEQYHYQTHRRFNELNSPGFYRHLGAIINGNDGGVCERKEIYG